MKKSIIYFMLCAVGCAAASCSRSDEPSAESDFDSAGISVRVTADKMTNSRAHDMNTTDPKPGYCVMQIYVIGDNSTLSIPDIDGNGRYSADFNEAGVCSFEIKDLDRKQNYRFAFWAAENGATPESGFVTDTQEAVKTLSDLKFDDIVLSPGFLAFSGYKDVMPVDGEEIPVTLSHVVARIDFEHTGAAPLSAGDRLSWSMEYSGFSFDASTGLLENLSETMLNAAMASQNVDTDHLSGKVMTTYVMVPGGDNAQLVNLEVNYEKNGGAMGSTPLILSNVPVKANCRTIIRGDFSKLYNGVQQEFSAELEKEWEDDNNEIIPE